MAFPRLRRCGGRKYAVVLDSFLKDGSWPEASELVAKIRKQRAQRALDVAIETATVGHSMFGQRHPGTLAGASG